jgi:hypothetical protein
MHMYFFYRYWSDSIIGVKRYSPNKRDWKSALFIKTTVCNSLNIWVVMLWLKYFDVYTFDLSIDIFPGTILNNASEFVVRYAAPFVFLNYFLVFHKDRYKRFVGKYPDNNGWFAAGYDLVSIFIALVSFFLYDYLS